MKTHLRLLLLALLFCGLTIPGYSQIDYSEDFEAFAYDWEGFDFYDSDVVPCEGEYSFITNLYSGVTVAETTSPSLGVSSGLEMTLTYDYKLMNYASEPVDPTLNSSNWGSFEVSYSSSPDGPFTVLETINTTNHVESTTCATRTVTFTPPLGENVYIKFYAEIDDTTNDFYVIYDNISVVQDVPACTGTPTASVTVASTVFVCNTADVQLSLNPVYLMSGLSFQWQSSADGITYTDVAAGGDGPTYTTTQTATTWYQAVITCDASEEFVTSTPVQVVSSGLDCLCDIEFDADVEPITLVNFAGINNVTSAEVNGTPGLEDFSSLTAGEVIAGETYTITLEGNTNGETFDTYFTVYIDFNQNGDLNDPGESFEAGLVSGSTGEDGEQAITSITIPEDAMEGMTYMRVLKLYDSYADDPCSSVAGIGYGQAEDYILNISMCTTAAPTADAEQLFCDTATVAGLTAEGTATSTIVWYADAEGGEPLAAETEVVDGETYYAAQIDVCESILRTEVTVTISTVSVDDMEDVTACNSYELPAPEFGVYYTEPGGTGEILETGAVIEESMTVYIYSESGTTPNCTAETSFEVTINIVGQLSGEAVQTFETGATIADLVITGEEGAVIAWYASEEDAIAGEAVLSADTALEDGVSYFATQTLDGCTSEPFAVLAEAALGLNDFDKSSVTYYPNPVKDNFTVSSASLIDTVEIYNLIGQQVLFAKIGSTEAQLDLSSLAAGTYMVKVMAGESLQTIKIIKQ